MAANQRDLWPVEMILKDEPQSPLAILKEQASLLGKKTGNIEEQFTDILKRVFADEKTLKVINSLLSQSALAKV